MGGGGDIDLAALAVLAHGDGLGGGGGPVVVGSVGHIHPGELAEHGLELKDALERALADLGLIGGVAGDQLLPGGDGLHHRGDKVPVSARAPENGAVHMVFGRQVGDLGLDLQLGKAGGDLQIAGLETHGRGNVLIERLERIHPDDGEHLRLFPGGRGDIMAHAQPSWAQKAS